MRLVAVVAMGQNHCIGLDNRMPWHIPEDLAHFKALTMGKTVLMGRKTFESILATLGRPLPGRPQMVLTRSSAWTPEVVGADPITRASSLADALEMARARGLDELMVIGGAEIYSQCMAQLDVIEATEIEASPEGDAFFPPLDPSQWVRTPGERGESKGLAYTFVRHERRGPR